VEAGLPKTQGLLWVYGQALRAVFDHVLFADYHQKTPRSLGIHAGDG
jgi:hypothetical protein